MMGPRCSVRRLFPYATLLFALANCAKSREPARSGAPISWHSVTTEHFVLYTDLDERTVLEAARELEITRDSLISAAWPKFKFPDLARTRVYVLANGLDFEREF